MSATFTMTAGEIITDAAENNGLLAEGAATNTAQQTRGLRLINKFLKRLQAKGIDVFARATKSVTLTADKASYTLGESGADVTMVRPVTIVGAVLRDTASEDVPIKIFTKEEYEAITDKDAEGPPVGLWYDLGTLATGTIYPWPIISDSGYSLRLDYRRPLNDVAAVGDAIDLQQEWLTPLVSAVEVGLAKKYGRPADTQGAAVDLHEALGTSRQLPPNPLIGWPGESDG